MKSRRTIAYICFAALFSYILYHRHEQSKQTPYQHNEGTVFGTLYHISYQYDDNLEAGIKTELKQFDQSLSMFNKNSVISRVNRNDTTVLLDPWFIQVFEQGQKIAAITQGAFDMTVAPLVNAWGFGFKKSERLTPQQIDSIRHFIGYTKLRLQNGKIQKNDPRTMLDASAIAKGYACDVIAQYLQAKGIDNYMVEIGGEVAAKGKNNRGACWRIGINKPIEDQSANPGEIEEVIQLCDGGMATSGNYRNFYYKDGKKYAHTIDPRTGYPVQHTLLSATVIAPTCMEADAFATSFMVLGLEKSIAIATSQPQIAAFFIYEDQDGKNAILSTENFNTYLLQ